MDLDAYFVFNVSNSIDVDGDDCVINVYFVPSRDPEMGHVTADFTCNAAI